jgi:tetraacyldisaccharide 4'-kinase
MQSVLEKINPTKDQNVYFTRYEYKNLYHLLYPEIEVRLQPNMHALVVSAIANSEYLLGYVDSIVSSVRAIEYEDHHDFTSHEIAQLKTKFDSISEDNKIIITTEKDAMRMQKHADFLRDNQMPIFVLPAYVSFVQDEQSFQQRVKSFLLEFKS